jgi:GNAT superfamily N-acetyltransferase
VSNAKAVMIHHSNQAMASPAWPLLVEGFNELVQDGYATSQLLPGENDKALYIRSPDGDIVAALAYRFEAATGSAIVRLVYVEPSSRRLGLFKALWRDLITRAGNANCNNIQVEVSADDAIVLGVFANHCGAKASAIRFTRSIK